MVQLKQLFTLFLASIFFVIACTLTGCNKSDSNPVGGSASLDQLLVGVWWNSSGGSGIQIASDGTSLSLTSYAGKIAVDTSASARMFTEKISASGGSGTYTLIGKSPSTGKDTTITGTFTYILSNSNNTLSITAKEDSVIVTTLYDKKNIGDAVSTPVSITFDGTLYSFSSVFVEAGHDTLSIYAYISGGASCEIMFLNQVGTQTVGTSLALVTFAPNTSTYYSSSAGTITVTTVSGKNTQGTFSVTMTNYLSPTVTKSATGSFNVTRN